MNCLPYILQDLDNILHLCDSKGTLKESDVAFEDILAEFLRWRALERIMATGVGGLSIYLGYYLFKLGVVEAQSAEFENGNFKLRLIKVGPGVFFSLFGAALIAYVTYQHPKLEQIATTAQGFAVESSAANDGTAEPGSGQSGAPFTVRTYAGFSSGTAEELGKFVPAINTLRETSSKLFQRLSPEADEETRALLNALTQAAGSLNAYKDLAIFNFVPSAVHDACRDEQAVMPEGYNRDTCKKLRELEESTL